MYTLFVDRDPRASRVVTPPRFPYLKRGLRKNLTAVLRYCRQANHAVRSNHLLVKLLIALDVDPNLPLLEYHRKVQARAERVVRAHGLTTALHRGGVLTDELFYGDRVREVLLAVTESFDLLSVEEHWRGLTPVVVRRHPFDEIAIEVLDGRANTDAPSWAVIQIDPIKLALQYRQWYWSQKRAGEPFLRTPMQFVFEYPLTNALISHLDLALVNRLKCHLRGTTPGTFYSSWPFYLRDYDALVDDYLLELLTQLTRSPMRYAEMLKQVRLVGSHEDLYGFSRLPETAVTRQNSWVLTLSVLPTLELLAQVDEQAGGARNTQEMRLIQRRYLEMRQDRTMDVGLTPTQADEVHAEIEQRILAYL